MGEYAEYEMADQIHRRMTWIKHQHQEQNMKISDAFASKYIKAADLQGQRVSVTINNVAVENVGKEDKPENKPVVYFMGRDKGLVLNKTNGEQISSMYGDETDAWQGKNIELFTQKVPFNGQMVDAIRIAPPPNVNQTGQPMPDGRPTLNTPPPQPMADAPYVPGPVGDPLDDDPNF